MTTWWRDAALRPRRNVLPAQRAASERRCGVFRVLMWAMVLAVAPVDEVGAQGDSTTIDEAPELSGVAALVELPGRCPAATPIEQGIGVDCFFDLLPDADPDLLEFSELVLGSEWWSCRLERSGEPPRLVCPDVFDGRFSEGPAELELRVGDQSAAGAVTIDPRWDVEASAAVFSMVAGEPVVFEGRPLGLLAFRYEPAAGVYVVVRERAGDEIVASFEIDPAELFEGVEQTIEPGLPPGRYRYWPCLGPSPDDCEERPGGRPFQVISGEPLELVSGHNRPSAERINVLFVASGLEQQARDVEATPFPDLARQMLGLDGPIGDRFDGQIVDPPERVARLLWGPMAIEPLASHHDRFNFWYLADDIADEEALLFSGSERDGDIGFDLPNLQITALYNDPASFASDARATTFERSEPDTVPHFTRIGFGDARVWISEFDPLGATHTLAHEWGHGLFGLRDEYYGFDGRPISIGYPNCAPDEATAESWWGDLAGTVDPFVDRVEAAQLQRLDEGLVIEGELAERTVIETTPGGCYSDPDSIAVFRPSTDSLMNSEIPVFGTVNRQRVEEVLDRFSGRGPMTSLDDLALTCEGLRNRIECRGELRTHLDEPFSIVAVDSVPCTFGPARRFLDAVEPVPVSCVTEGRATEPVELTFLSERRSVPVENLNPPVTPRSVRQPLPSAESSDAEPGDGADDGGSDGEGGPGTGRTVAIGALLCFAAVALAWVERRRHSDDADRPLR